MYIIDALIGLWNLKWTQQQPDIRQLPSHITRKYIKTPQGDLELLISKPKSPSNSAPIFFAHGGCGSAGVWLEWMNYLHTRNWGGTIYAYSLRNHGASYTLPYREMVHKVTFEDLQSDMKACLNEVEGDRAPIIVGHSSGGGLSQVLLSKGVKASGLCLIGAITSYGSYDLYWNWMKNDPWFFVRSFLHGQHPNSPLHNDKLVHQAFFGHKFPMSRTGEFRSHMPAFEAMAWPMGMTGSFWSWWKGEPKWLDCKDIVRNIDQDGSGDKVCVIVGKEDMMYRPWMWEKQCELYREALERKTEKSEKKDGVVLEQSQDGVRLLSVEDSGHHVQNDVYHDEAAEAFMRWAKQV